MKRPLFRRAASIAVSGVLWASVCAAAVVAGGGTAAAAPGSFDGSFGSGGVVTYSGGSQATGVAVVPPGVTGAGDIVVSAASSATPSQFQVNWFSPAGGYIRSVIPFAGVANAIAVVPQGATNAGDVVAAGADLSTNTIGGCPVVVEYTPTGALNTAFGTGGILHTANCPTAGASFAGIAVTPTGTMVAAGQSSGTSGPPETFVAWLSAAGAVTASNVQALPGTSQSAAKAVTVTAAGDAVTAGYSVPSAGLAQDQFTLAEFSTSAQLVPGFGSGGVVEDGAGFANGVTALPDGNVVAAGAAGTSGYSTFQLAQFDPTGTSVWTQTDVPSTGASDEYDGVAYDPATNLIVATGHVIPITSPPNNGSTRNVVVGQYHPATGAPNTSFGSGGLVQLPYTNSLGTGGAGVAVQPNGMTVVGATVPRVGSVTQISAMRLMGPSLSVGNGASLTVHADGHFNVRMPVSIDEPVDADLIVYMCAPGGVINSVGVCTDVRIPAGTTTVSVTVTVDVTNTPGHSQVQQLQARSGMGFSISRAVGEVTITHLPPPPTYSGYWFVASDGGVFAFGQAGYYGSMGGTHLVKPIVGMAATPDGRGYWLVASDGGIFAFGDAAFHGSTGGVPLVKPIVGMAATPDGRGYWMVASDGGIFAFGDAGFYGSTGGVPLVKPIVGMAATPDGRGYWLVASDGGIFAFGDARFFGSTGGVPLVKPIVGMAANSSGGGYWLVASDGGIFAFGDARFHGSTGGIPLVKPVVTMASTYAGGGYWLVASDGGVFAFGNAPFYGSTGNVKLVAPIVGMAG